MTIGQWFISWPVSSKVIESVDIFIDTYITNLAGLVTDLDKFVNYLV